MHSCRGGACVWPIRLTRLCTLGLAVRATSNTGAGIWGFPPITPGRGRLALLYEGEQMWSEYR